MSPPPPTYYELLGTARDASVDEINRAFRKLSASCHPDKLAVEDKEAGEEKFKVLSHARDILNDEKERQKYDSNLPRWSPTKEKEPKSNKSKKPKEKRAWPPPGYNEERERAAEEAEREAEEHAERERQYAEQARKYSEAHEARKREEAEMKAKLQARKREEAQMEFRMQQAWRQETLRKEGLKQEEARKRKVAQEREIHNKAAAEAQAQYTAGHKTTSKPKSAPKPSTTPTKPLKGMTLAEIMMSSGLAPDPPSPSRSPHTPTSKRRREEEGTPRANGNGTKRARR